MNRSSVHDLLPARGGLPKLREAAAGCQACELYRKGTQTVFGDGTSTATLMLVGEQPGDREDRTGKPFVGPAGRVLDEALEEVGLDPGDTYVTNIVKHFNWEPRGKRRIHQKPRRPHIEACRPWFEAELEVVRPRALVMLGATAAQALLGSSFRVTKQRGEPVDSDLAEIVVATVHPSSVLRAPDDERAEARSAFVDDLRAVAVRLR